ncbi:hypothetical protein K469DRAFT_709908 [Zopfia rhizophila CBS 207.26]|uniref:Xylanolytic transcriptional activator regulatory domain-containing protein n=1 Tax=Zopfia rhizophila CBS 207.26 TaxID=1314779 RepID=A0A6A6DYC1_9PEZI|nr:hypothetical protein K469DRAFT_709908 [Zopfia rhizophila CBS 207.26]
MREPRNRPISQGFQSHNSSSSVDNCLEISRDDVASRQHGSLQADSRKRKLDQPILADSLLELDFVDIAEYLPSQPLLLKLVDYFCVSFHHWIPYLHKGRLRASACSVSREAHLTLVFHALVAATLRHMDRDVLFLDEDQIEHQTKISRFITENFAMKNVSLESLRALIIIVFDYLNDGQARKAWPLIGSLTRTVDYLQLTLEPSASQFGALMNPLKLIHPTDNWTELEERRRLFWVVFLLDRFCSISTGWNTSLTSEDVHRRLPADGRYFTREEPVTTPYFGIWNKSAARIGKSLAHVPGQYNEDDPVLEHVQGSSPGSANGLIDSSKLGAFAYCIEATESLSQVTTFFLQQRINWQDKEHAVKWLTRFKELDLRLVHWKLFLPPRWKDSNISPDTEVVDMDPNLTLAHITHNTSMILLHHPIAYPAKVWNDYVALPKECSAQTCEHAAVETSNIVDKFLTHTRIDFVNVQFAFCTFAAAKALLFESQATRKPIQPEFQRLKRNLWEMSARWKSNKNGPPNSNGYHDQLKRTRDQAGMYALHLEYLQDACQRDSRFKFDLYDHSCQKPESQYLTSLAQTTTPKQFSGRILADRRQSTDRERSMSNASYSPVDPRLWPSTNAANTPNLPNVIYDTTLRPPVSYQQPQNLPQPVNPHIESPNRIRPSLLSPASTSNFLDQNQRPYPMNDHPTPGLANPQIQGLAANENPQHTVEDQSLLSLSDTFMDSQFLGLDRVITFEDANFFLPGDGFKWQ